MPAFPNAFDLPLDGDALSNAIDSWNNAGSLLQFTLGSFAEPLGATLAEPDGINLIAFSNSEEFFEGETDVLAICRAHLTVNAYVCPNNPLSPYIPVYGFDIIFNQNKLFDVLNYTSESDLDYPYYDFESVLVHELGHAAGLCHHPSATQADVMFGAKYNADIRRNLSVKDIAAIKALYPTQPPYPPCEVFTQSQGDDVGRKRGNNTGGGGGSACYYIPPGAFSVEATREMTLFWERELGNNFNLLMRRFVQNTAMLNHILTASDSRYAGVQTAFSNALTTLTPLIEGNFAQNDSTKITAAHINAVCCWVDELLPLFNEVEFYREPLFLQELLNLQKGLNSLLNKDARTALLHYDNIADFSGLGACSCSGKRSIDDTMNFYVSAQQGYISLHSQLTQEATLQYLIYDTGGKMSGSIIAGQLPAGKHTENIQRGVLKTGLYIIVPVIDGWPLRSNALKVSAF